MTSGSTDILTWDLSNGSTARAPIGWPPGPAPDSAIPSTGWTSFSWPIYGAVQLEHLAGPLRKNVYGEYPSRSASVEAGNRYQGGLPAEPFSGGAPSGWKPEKVTKALAGRLRAGGDDRGGTGPDRHQKCVIQAPLWWTSGRKYRVDRRVMAPQNKDKAAFFYT